MSARRQAAASAVEPPLVAHVIHHLHMGGMENGVVNLVNRMPAGAYRHMIICVEDSSDFRQRIERQDVDVVCLHRSAVGIWAMRRALLALFREHRPEIVHTRNLSGLDALPVATLAGVRARIHGEHGRDESDPDGRARKPALLRWLHKPFVSHYVTVSRDIGRYLQDRVGVSPGVIEHICNGVDSERFSPRVAGSPSVLPPELHRPGACVIGTVGRAQPVKNQLMLLESFAALCRRPEVRSIASHPLLVVVGDGPLLEPLRSKAASLGLDDHVWIPGARDDMPEVLRSLDVFVLPSAFEGISNTLLEAMSCGLPVLATAVGGNPELVEEGISGRTFPVGAVDRLADLLSAYVCDADLRRQHGRNARQAIVATYSLDAMVARYTDLYDRALGHGSRRSEHVSS